MGKRKRDSPDSAQATGPAYQYNPRRNVGPSCAAYNDFCYLCEFSRHDCGDTNYVEEIRQLALQLGREKKELPVVVQAVSRAYAEGAKQWVVYEHPDTGAEISRPDWSKESITRHLLHCAEYGFYNDTINYMFQNIIKLEQESVIDPVNETVIQEQKDNLLRSIAAYGDWLVKRGKIENQRCPKRA